MSTLDTRAVFHRGRPAFYRGRRRPAGAGPAWRDVANRVGIIAVAAVFVAIAAAGAM